MLNQHYVSVVSSIKGLYVSISVMHSPVPVTWRGSCEADVSSPLSVCAAPLLCSRWALDRLHTRGCRKQAEPRPRAAATASAQSEPAVTVGVGQLVRWARLAQSLPTGHQVVQEHTRWVAPLLRAAPLFPLWFRSRHLRIPRQSACFLSLHHAIVYFSRVYFCWFFKLMWQRGSVSLLIKGTCPEHSAGLGGFGC